MLRSQPVIFAVAIAAGLSMFSIAQAQCGPGNCGETFGYPQTGGVYQGGGRLQNLHDQWDQMRQQSEKIRARNDAWPKPFACADRQAYHNIWNGFYEGGWINHCTLIDAHFDSESGALNRLGQSVIQGLMKNNPESRREIFIYDGRSSIDYLTKRQSVVDVVNQWYGDKTVQVTATNRWPLQGNGLRREMTNQLYTDGTPPPVIAIPTGTGSTSDVNSGN